MLLHELRGFQLMSSRSAPAARRSVSEVSAAISSKMLQRIDGGFDADRGLDVRSARGFGFASAHLRMR